ncbi:hypothetical protein C8R48DRAFT_597303, partial [Suillus tomentosus]
FSIKYTLTRHTKVVNILAVNVNGTLLLTGGNQPISHLTCTDSWIGNDSRIVVWSFVSGEMMQEIFTPAAGYISAIT